jgi:hypothetical protein
MGLGGPAIEVELWGPFPSFLKGGAFDLVLKGCARAPGPGQRLGKSEAMNRAIRQIKVFEAEDHPPVDEMIPA